MPPIEKHAVALSHSQLSSLQEAVASGDYADISEALDEAMTDWQTKRRSENERLGRLWDEGLASGESGPLNIPELRQEAQRRLAILRKLPRDAG